MAQSGFLTGPGTVRVDPTIGNMIVDPYGKPYPAEDYLVRPFLPPTDPLRGIDPEKVAGTLLRSIPITALQTTWTIGQIRGALDAHQIGLFQASSDLLDQIIADDRIEPTLGSRLGGLFGRPIRHLPANPKLKARKVREEWRENWQRTDLRTALQDVKKSTIMMGFGIAQVLWDTTIEPWGMTLRPWSPKYVYYRHDIRRFVAITQDGPLTIEPGDGTWFVHAPTCGDYRPWMHGAIRATADKWFIKVLAWRDWARFNERHGMPMILAEVPAIADPVQKKNFVESLSRLGQEAVVALPKNIDGTGFDMKLLEAKDRAWESFQGTIDRADKALILAIKWQHATTELGEGGSYAAARVHGDVEQVALEFDEGSMAFDIHHQLARPFAAFNFGDANLAPWTRWRITPPEDTKLAADTLNSFATALKSFRDAGIKLDVAKLAKKYGVKISGDMIEMIEPTTVQAKAAGADATTAGDEGDAEKPADADDDDEKPAPKDSAAPDESKKEPPDAG